MVARLFKVLLGIAAICGGVRTFQEAATQWKLAGEYRRLAATWGDLELSDPFRVHVLALDTGDPLHFAWRMYLPPDCTGAWDWSSCGRQTSRSRWQNVSSSSIPYDGICRVRFRKDARLGWQVLTVSGTTSSLLPIEPSLARQLDRGIQTLRVTRAGAARSESFGPEELVTLIQIEPARADRADGEAIDSHTATASFQFGLEQTLRNLPAERTEGASP